MKYSSGMLWPMGQSITKGDKMAVFFRGTMYVRPDGEAVCAWAARHWPHIFGCACPLPPQRRRPFIHIVHARFPGEWAIDYQFPWADKKSTEAMGIPGRVHRGFFNLASQFFEEFEKEVRILPFVL